jgi:hypothetical protein
VKNKTDYQSRQKSLKIKSENCGNSGEISGFGTGTSKKSDRVKSSLMDSKFSLIFFSLILFYCKQNSNGIGTVL